MRRIALGVAEAVLFSEERFDIGQMAFADDMGCEDEEGVGVV